MAKRKKEKKGQKKASAQATDMKTGMTLGEIENVIAAARQWGFTSDARVRAGMGWSSQIQTINLIEDVDVGDVWDPHQHEDILNPEGDQ